MPFRNSCRRRKQHPSTCDMGNLYRFVEPILLFLLRRKGHSYGYELASELPQYALTDAKIESSALYKTLRQLEQNGCLASKWDVGNSGPARKLYALTPRGKEHLEEWIAVLDHICTSMVRLIAEARSEAHTTDSDNQTRPSRERPAARVPHAERIS